MGQGTLGGLNRKNDADRKNEGYNKKKKFEPSAPPSRVGRKQCKQKGSEVAARLPTVTPLSKCKFRLLKLERIKDYLLMEEEFVANQERLKSQEDRNEEDRSKVDDLRGTPMTMSVGNLEELIDKSHAIVSSSVGPEYYVGILSFMDKDQLEPGCMHNKVAEGCDRYFYHQWQRQLVGCSGCSPGEPREPRDENVQVSERREFMRDLGTGEPLVVRDFKFNQVY